ncbi:MAG: tetratricopeptide repeat protein [Deltaproteobacteria bacterium]|nr:tetratricopeptide repeat protein [Deltaproteobacteria bacterium]
MHSLRRVSLVLAVLAALGAAQVATAQDKTEGKPGKAEKPAKKADKKKDDKAEKAPSEKADKKDDKPGVAKGITEYDKQLIEADKAFAAGVAGGQLDDAIALYRKAITVDPNRPEGHVLLGGAFYQKGDYAASEEALVQGVNRAKADKAFTNYLGKALFLTATVKEALKKSEEARGAWKAYEDFAKANPDQPFPEGSGDNPPMAIKVYPGSAVERQAKLEAYDKSINEYAKVKEAIIKRQKELGIDPNIKASTAK